MSDGTGAIFHSLMQTVLYIISTGNYLLGLLYVFVMYVVVTAVYFDHGSASDGRWDNVLSTACA